MSENKNKGGQQPNVEKLNYVIDEGLTLIGDSYYYELINKDDINDVLYISTHVITLAPKFNVYVSINNSDECVYEECILDIHNLDFNDSFWKKESNSTFLYKDENIEILFVGELDLLNRYHSGMVMDLVTNDENLIITSDNYDLYELKLDKSLIIESIARKFTKIFVFSNDLLNGFRVTDIKINPESLFNVDHSVDFNKPVLATFAYDKKCILSKDDLWLLKKDKIYTFINNFATHLFFWGTGFILFLNFLASKNVFTFDVSLTIFYFVIIALFLFLHSLKIYKDKKYQEDGLKRKNELKSKINNANIIGTIFGGLVLYAGLLGYSNHYKYKTDFVYDTNNSVFLDSNSFDVDKSLFLETDKIVKRFIPIINRYTLDLVYQTPNSLLSFSNKFLDLEVNFEFKKGKYLLDGHLEKVLSDIRNVMQKNISLGLYGKLSSMNSYNYRVNMIEIERDVMQLLTAYLDSNKIKSENIVKKVTVTTKYAKLQNVEN